MSIGQRRQLAESQKDKFFSLLPAHKLKTIIFFVSIFMAGLTAIHLLLLVLLFFFISKTLTYVLLLNLRVNKVYVWKYVTITLMV